MLRDSTQSPVNSERSITAAATENKGKGSRAEGGLGILPMSSFNLKARKLKAAILDARRHNRSGRARAIGLFCQDIIDSN